MSSNQDLPITALCVVSEQNKCPPNYHSISKSYDTNTEIDLWKDGLFGKKLNRFICFTKDYPIEDTYYVIEDIKILNEKEKISGFIPIEKCQDSSALTFQKKQLCIKTAHRFYTETAVSDIIVLVRNKRAPIGYTYIGEINQHSICIKFSKIPQASSTNNMVKNSPSYPQLNPPPRPPRPATNDSLYNIEKTFVHVESPPVPGSINGFSNNQSNSNQRIYQSQSSHNTAYNPLQGVPFEINPIYDSIKSKSAQDELYDVQRLENKLRAMNENLEKYDYDFKLERSCLFPSSTF